MSSERIKRGLSFGVRVVFFTLLGTGISSAQEEAAPSPDPGFEKLSEPLAKITAHELEEFEAGLEVFQRGFGPPQGGGGPGVGGGGPLRNTFGPNSCVQCHSDAVNPATGEIDGTKDGAGHAGFRASQVTAYDPETGSCDNLEYWGGPGFQTNTLALGPMRLAALAQEVGGPFEDFNGEYIPLVSKHGVPTGPRDDRTTNDLFGLGLLDEVLDLAIWLSSDPHDRNRDGISGRVHWVRDHHGVLGIGKFGRKAEIADLDEFNAEAFLNEQGVTTDEFPSDGVLVVDKIDDTNLITASLDDRFADPELSHHDLELVNAYVRFLAPPEQNPGAMTKKDHRKGRRLFKRVGCADCHTPAMVTGLSKSRALRFKVIRPFTDLLLHDMGPELAENCKGDATPQEWRTEPLWGLRFVPAGFMHDGRAETIEEAIELHGGEAAKSRKKFRKLNDRKRGQLLDYLNTL